MTAPTAREALEAVGSAVAMAQYESRWTPEEGAEHSAGLAYLIRVIDAAEKVRKRHVKWAMRGDAESLGRLMDDIRALAAALKGEAT